MSVPGNTPTAVALRAWILSKHLNAVLLDHMQKL